MWISQTKDIYIDMFFSDRFPFINVFSILSNKCDLYMTKFLTTTTIHTNL